MLLALNKPCGVLAQFSPDGSAHATLRGLGLPDTVHPIGRLDADSEGLLLLTDEPGITHGLLHPRFAHRRIYWAQVEGAPDAETLGRLERGVAVAGRQTRPCRVRLLDPPPVLWARVPPIRRRKSIPTSWIELELAEGRNRQVRHMTAAVGFPTLRLVRVGIGEFRMRDLAPGQWRILDEPDRRRVMAACRT